MRLLCSGFLNNQLATEADGARLVARGITYAPDYVVNAGGIINVSVEFHPGAAKYYKEIGLLK